MNILDIIHVKLLSGTYATIKMLFIRNDLFISNTGSLFYVVPVALPLLPLTHHVRGQSAEWVLLIQ